MSIYKAYSECKYTKVNQSLLLILILNLNNIMRKRQIKINQTFLNFGFHKSIQALNIW